MPTKHALVSTLLLPLALGASLTATAPSYAAPATSTTPLPTIAVGQRHSLLIAGDGRVWGAGTDDSKQIGSCGTVATFCELPPLPDGRRAIAVAVSKQSSYALSSGGTVYGMGRNDEGQLTGPDTTVDHWRRLAGQPSTVTSLSAAGKTVAVTGSDGRAYLTGANSCKLTGGATSFSTLTPMEVYTGADIGARRVSVGSGDFCVVVGAHGKAWAVGDNSAGQTTANNGKLVWLNAPAAGVSVRAAAVGDSSTAVLGSDGNVYSIGANANYQFGDGTKTSATEAKWAQMGGINGRATSVAVGGTTVVVGTAGGTVYGVGFNSNGALTGSTSEVTAPTLLSGATAFDPVVEVTLSEDGDTSFLRDSTGVVSGSGYGGYCQLATDCTTLTTVTIGDGQVMAPSADPSVSGPAAVGGKLTARVGAWSIVPDAYDVQWRRNGVAVPGASGPTYTPTNSDAGASLSSRVSGVRLGFTSKTAQSATVRIPARNTVTPSFTGKLTRGSRLTARKGTWYATGYAFAYQWLRNGKAITHATRTTYKVTAKDHRAKLSLRVTATKPAFKTVTATSKPKTAK
ncbi:RCC1 domain-containing protein [Nocardioides sp. URHA0020]|uniref:RCC1 domain-containing protein n=1 Tax=Nocardioides sp. URHA0020 TaxID=1380392 RepID=UPI00048B0897|nr:hypothetical protein [Nocardioides sp. URHA0020]